MRDVLLPEYDAVRSACHQRSAERLLKLACDNGGVFVKVTQKNVLVR